MTGTAPEDDPRDTSARRRRHRRVVAPGTGTAGSATPDEDAARHAQVRRELGLDEPDAAPAGESERDRWFREQRPPHWG